MWIAFVSLAFGATGYYFFSQGRYILGGLFLLWACLGPLAWGPLEWIAAISLVNRYYHVERDCNVSLVVGINMAEVVKHAALNRTFETLQKNNLAGDADRSAWGQSLLDNYKRKYHNPGTWETVRFHVKSNLVWKNGQVDFSDAIWHEIFIPYESAGDAAAEYAPGFPPSLASGLTVRLILVNGILKLMAGDYSKEISPDQFTGLGAEVYRARETIASFPLLYFPSEHRLPDRYMNFSASATDSYKNFYSANRELSKKFHADWMKLRRDIRKYLYACQIPKENVPHVIEGPRWKKIIKEFDGKKEEWLRREGFQPPSTDGVVAGGAEPSIRYENACLRVALVNYGDSNHGDVAKKLQKRIQSDYVIEGEP